MIGPSVNLMRFNFKQDSWIILSCRRFLILRIPWRLFLLDWYWFCTRLKISKVSRFFRCMLRLSSVGELELWHVRMFYMDIYLIRCQAVIIQSKSTLEFQFRIFGTTIYHDKYMIFKHSIDSMGERANSYTSYTAKWRDFKSKRQIGCSINPEPVGLPEDTRLVSSWIRFAITHEWTSININTD